VRRKSMQVSIESILSAHGKLATLSTAFVLDSEFYLKLSQPNYDNLIIEKVAPDRIAIAHYFIQNGDVMWDPEIVFSYTPGFPEASWMPVEITQSPLGVYRSRYVKRDGKTYVDSRFHSDVSELVRVWAKNLSHQNWDQAKVVAELPNPKGGETE